MAAGSNVTALGYNNIRKKIAAVLGNGGTDPITNLPNAQLGYGQSLVSNELSSGAIITKAQWDALRIDLYNIKLHQAGLVDPILTPAERSVITFGAGFPNTNYDSIATQTITTKFNIATSQSKLTSAIISPVTRTGAWATTSQCFVTVAFSTADRARWFFNSGGRIRFSSTRTGGANSVQNTNWTNLLASAGVQEFGAVTPAVRNFYNLTTSYNTWYQSNSSSSYSSNYYRIEALCNCTGANNSTGTATTITFRVTWQDSHTPRGTTTGSEVVRIGGPGPVLVPGPEGLQPTWPVVRNQGPAGFGPDFVDGTLTLTVGEFKAEGRLLRGINDPEETFSITSPIYTATPINSDLAASGAIYTITPNDTLAAEGTSIIFTITTSGVADGTIIFWNTISTQGYTTASDFSDNRSSGSITINNDTATLVRALRSGDGDAVPNDKFRIRLTTGSLGGTVVATSDDVEIVDTLSSSGSLTFSGTTPQTWAVPSGITRVRIIAQGGGGGGGGSDFREGYVGSTGSRLEGILTVSPLEILQFYPGNGGGPGSSDAATPVGGTAGANAGGWSGGAGSPAGATGTSGSGGGGGGASVVIYDGSPVLVAAGGGGGGGGGYATPGQPPVQVLGALTSGTNGQAKSANGGGAGGGGGGNLGGLGGNIVDGDNGGFTGSNGSNLVPTGFTSGIFVGSGGLAGVRGVRPAGAGRNGSIYIQWGRGV